MSDLANSENNKLIAHDGQPRRKQKKAKAIVKSESNMTPHQQRTKDAEELELQSRAEAAQQNHDSSVEQYIESSIARVASDASTFADIDYQVAQIGQKAYEAKLKELEANGGKPRNFQNSKVLRTNTKLDINSTLANHAKSHGIDMEI